jgi:hypothetical protein
MESDETSDLIIDIDACKLIHISISESETVSSFSDSDASPSGESNIDEKKSNSDCSSSSYSSDSDDSSSGECNNIDEKKFWWWPKKDITGGSNAILVKLNFYDLEKSIEPNYKIMKHQTFPQFGSSFESIGLSKNLNGLVMDKISAHYQQAKGKSLWATSFEKQHNSSEKDSNSSIYDVKKKILKKKNREDKKESKRVINLETRGIVWTSLPGIEEYLKYKLTEKLKAEKGTDKERKERIREFRKKVRDHGKYVSEVQSFENCICRFVLFVLNYYGVNLGWLNFLSWKFIKKYLSTIEGPKSRSNQAKMLCDVLLFLRTNILFFQKLSPTGLYISGNTNLVRPKLSELKRNTKNNKKDYNKKISEGRSMTPEDKLEFYSTLITKMKELKEKLEKVEEKDNQDIMEYQKLLITGILFMLIIR